MNLFSSQKLKGNQTFTAQSATMDGNKGGEDSDAKPEKEEKVGSYTEDPEASSGFCRADQLISYIVHFGNAVELYWMKTWNCFGCGSSDLLIRDCPKDVGKIAQKASLYVKKGQLRDASPSETIWHAASVPGQGSLILNVWDISVLEPRSMYSLEQTWEHSLGQNWWWEQLDPPGQWFHH